MTLPIRYVKLVVKCITQETECIQVFELADEDDWDLPPFTPGAHIDVHLPNGMIRQYSLCGDPIERTAYRLGVLREKAGRGGSACFCDEVAVGSQLNVSLPRNHFPLEPSARRHIFIAGGIGITPFLPMVEQLLRESEDRGSVNPGGKFELHMCARSREVTPFHERLAQLADRGLVFFHYDGGEPARGLDVARLLADRVEGGHVYCCGPTSLMDAVATATAHWPAETVHFERFQAPAGASSGAGVEHAGFDVKLARSGRIVRIPPRRPILAVLREHGIEIESACDAGTCGSCRTKYLSGAVIHRDYVLKQNERSEYLMPCVSICASEQLVLDL